MYASGVFVGESTGDEATELRDTANTEDQNSEERENGTLSGYVLL